MGVAAFLFQIRDMHDADDAWEIQGMYLVRLGNQTIKVVFN